MSLQFSAAVRNARLDAFETQVGVSPKLRLYNGTPPADAAAALSGNTLLCEMPLPSDWMAAASGGVKAKSGSWAGTGAAGAGGGTAATFFRVYDNAGSACGLQGTVTVTGSGGDMTLDNVSIASGQAVAVNTFSLTDANA